MDMLQMELHSFVVEHASEMAAELARSQESATQSLPITAICIVADKNKCPKGFSALTKTADDGSDADLWKESSFSLFSRPVRYLALSRDIPETVIKGAPISVITDITVVKDSDPIPHGFVAIDYTADSKEKALRKRFICIKTEPRDSVVDAVGEVAVLNKTKKTPKGFTAAGEVDGALVVFKAVVIPQTFGIRQTASANNLPTMTTPSAASRLYPGLHGESVPSSLNSSSIGSPIAQKQKGVDGVPFKLHSSLTADKAQDSLPPLPFDVSRLDSDEFSYNFALERATLSV